MQLLKTSRTTQKVDELRKVRNRQLDMAFGYTGILFGKEGRSFSYSSI